MGWFVIDTCYLIYTRIARICRYNLGGRPRFSVPDQMEDLKRNTRLSITREKPCAYQMYIARAVSRHGVVVMSSVVHVARADARYCRCCTPGCPTGHRELVI